MLTDIFSSFDPATSSLFLTLPSPIFWITNLIFLTTLLSTFWIHPSSISQLLFIPKQAIDNQVQTTTGTHLKGFSNILSALFILIISLNLTGLFPYVFSTSSHLYFTLSLAFPIWLRLILSSAINAPSTFLARILPGGAPDWLNPFLVLVETLRILVRPITLSFRLAANIRAGHIVLALIGIYASSAILSSLTSFLTLAIIQIIYIIFELGICIIQAYIFCLLLSLYSDDHS